MANETKKARNACTLKTCQNSGVDKSSSATEYRNPRVRSPHASYQRHAARYDSHVSKLSIIRSSHTNKATRCTNDFNCEQQRRCTLHWECNFRSRSARIIKWLFRIFTFLLGTAHSDRVPLNHFCTLGERCDTWRIDFAQRAKYYHLRSSRSDLNSWLQVLKYTSTNIKKL